MGLPIGQHLDMQLTTAGGESVIKPYTPVSDDSRQGYVDFVIKVRKFCGGAECTQHRCCKFSSPLLVWMISLFWHCSRPVRTCCIPAAGCPAL